MNQKPFKKGQRAYSIGAGWGTVTDDSYSNDFPIIFVADSKAVPTPELTFTADGKRWLGAGSQCLFHGEPVITEFKSEPPPDIDVDTPIWVKGYFGWHRKHFAEWSKDGKAKCFPDGQTSHSVHEDDDPIEWKYYSLTDPNEN